MTPRCLAGLVAVHLLTPAPIAVKIVLAVPIVMTTAILLTVPRTAIGTAPHMIGSPIHLAHLVVNPLPFDSAVVLGHTMIAPQPTELGDHHYQTA